MDLCQFLILRKINNWLRGITLFYKTMIQYAQFLDNLLVSEKKTYYIWDRVDNKVRNNIPNIQGGGKKIKWWGQLLSKMGVWWGWYEANKSSLLCYLSQDIFLQFFIIVYSSCQKMWAKNRLWGCAYIMLKQLMES